MSDTDEEATGPQGGRDLRFGRGPRAVAGAIYGIVSVIAVIAGASHLDDSAGRVLGFAVISSTVIWAVHVYASMLADSGSEVVGWCSVLIAGVRHEIGIVEGIFVPLFIFVPWSDRVGR